MRAVLLFVTFGVVVDAFAPIPSQRTASSSLQGAFDGTKFNPTRNPYARGGKEPWQFELDTMYIEAPKPAPKKVVVAKPVVAKKVVPKKPVVAPKKPAVGIKVAPKKPVVVAKVPVVVAKVAPKKPVVVTTVAPKKPAAVTKAAPNKISMAKAPKAKAPVKKNTPMNPFLAFFQK
jgi:hypothetical protein